MSMPRGCAALAFAARPRDAAYAAVLRQPPPAAMQPTPRRRCHGQIRAAEAADACRPRRQRRRRCFARSYHQPLRRRPMPPLTPPRAITPLPPDDAEPAPKITPPRPPPPCRQRHHVFDCRLSATPLLIRRRYVFPVIATAAIMPRKAAPLPPCRRRRRRLFRRFYAAAPCRHGAYGDEDAAIRRHALRVCLMVESAAEDFWQAAVRRLAPIRAPPVFSMLRKRRYALHAFRRILPEPPPAIRRRPSPAWFAPAFDSPRARGAPPMRYEAAAATAPLMLLILPLSGTSGITTPRHKTFRLRFDRRRCSQQEARSAKESASGVILNRKIAEEL